jgi:Tfp pilus assembly protein PilN
VRAINLIPPEQRRGAGGLAGRTGGVVYVVLAGLVALVAAGVLYAVAVNEVATRQTTLAQINDETATVNAQVASLGAYVGFKTFSQQRIADVASLAAQRFDWPRAMAQIALSLPSNVRLTTLGGTASGGTGPSGTAGAAGTSGNAFSLGVTVNAPTLNVAGCAFGSVSRGQVSVAKLLSRVRALQDVTYAWVSTYDSTSCSGVAFNLTMTYGNAYGIPTPTLKASSDSTVGG